MMDWIKANWQIMSFAASFLVGGVTAWADTQNEIKSLKDAYVVQTENTREQKVTREQVIRQDEQLKAIKESQKTQEQLLRDLVRGQQEISRKVSK